MAYPNNEDRHSLVSSMADSILSIATTLKASPLDVLDGTLELLHSDLTKELMSRATFKKSSK